jgi:hypothetical protein
MIGVASGIEFLPVPISISFVPFAAKVVSAIEIVVDIKYEIC